MKKNQEKKSIKSLDTFKVLSFKNTSKIIGGGGCGKSGGGDTDVETQGGGK